MIASCSNIMQQLFEHILPCCLNPGKLLYLNTRFSCNVISSQFCKSSYLRPPCLFPFAWPGIIKYNKMPHYFLISSYHKTKLRPSDKIIKIHTRLKFQILLQSISKVPASFVVFLHSAPCKRKPRSGAKSCAYRCVLRRANPL